MILFRIYVIYLRIKPNCCRFFFSYFIQLCDSRTIHYLTREFRVKLHLKTDIALIASREFPRQVMNFPLEYAIEALQKALRDRNLKAARIIAKYLEEVLICADDDEPDQKYDEEE